MYDNDITAHASNIKKANSEVSKWERDVKSSQPTELLTVQVKYEGK
jgi:hypothetical protein